MEIKRSSKALLWIALAALLSQNLVASTANLGDEKNYYTPTPTPDPNAHPPPVSYTPPSHGSGGGHATPTPSHGTPSHGGSPSHGGGSHGGSPPSNCGTPPSGHHHTPSTPGGSYYPPSTPTPSTPTPTTPTPSTPTPTTPTYTPAPPTTPIDPGTPTTPSPPSITIPSPPFSFNPTSPPFTCIYWRNHPTLIWALFGWWGTVGNAFGMPGSTPGGFGTPTLGGLGTSMNLLQALSNTRTDGYGELYREGTAALLNSMSHTRFPYTTNQVQNSFVAALSSNQAATAQAQLFKLANEGKIKPRALTCLVYPSDF